MGAWYNHECDNCGYTINTQGPWEFYRDQNGVRKQYGHPGPSSKEAEEQGISGFSGIFYCNQCDSLFESVLVEFRTPAKESLDVWKGVAEPREDYKENVIKCPRCANNQLLFDDQDIEEIKCPRCKKGKFVSWMDTISLISI